MNGPSVSVLIPTRNRESFLERALDSVLGQTFTDLEILVSDDASEDGTADLLRRVKDPRVRALTQHRRLGIPRNRNACLEAARGRYLVWLDSDDELEAGTLQSHVTLLDDYPNIVLAHGAFKVIDADGLPLPDWSPAHSGDRRDPGHVAFEDLVMENCVGSSTAIVRHAAARRAGPYCEELETSEDWDMWLRLSRLGAVAYCSRPLARYRHHRGSASREAEFSGSRLVMEERVLDRTFADTREQDPDYLRIQSQARASLALRALEFVWDAWTRGAVQLARGALKMAWDQAPQLDQAELESVARALLAGDEAGLFDAQRALVERLEPELQGTRPGARLARGGSETDRIGALQAIARKVQEIVPAEDPIAVVDRSDPTLRRLTGRTSWTFPDRAQLPLGYPADSATAVRHLTDFIDRGARWLVFSTGTTWWLDYYDGFAHHLEHHHDSVWRDDRCVLFRLKANAEARQAN